MKLKMKMKMVISVLSLITVVTLGKSQVGINTDTPKAALEIAKSKTTTVPDGLMLPHLTGDEIEKMNVTTEHNSLLVYATEISTNANPQIKKTGYWYYNGTSWQQFSGGGSVPFFYMPSFNLPLDAVEDGKTFNLYDEYVRQFSKAGNNKFISSNASLENVPSIYAANELDFLVTDYDHTIIKVNSISTEGILNYNVLNTTVSPDSFVNIIFVVK